MSAGGAAGLGDRDRRRALGAWYTPAWLVDGALDTVLGGVAPAGLDGRSRPAGEPLRVLDPACGDGRFLAAVAARAPGAQLTGIDIDPDAIEAARAALGGAARLVCADALAHDWGGERFDLVVGNPPFLSQLARATARGGRSALGGGAYADTATLFLALAVRLVRPGGRVVLVLPRSVLATRDAAPIRHEVAAAASLDAMWVADRRAFDADVLTIVAAFTRAGQQRAVRRWAGEPPAPIDDVRLRAGALTGPTWSALVADLDGAPVGLADRIDGEPLGTFATATADFRDQYYGLVGAVYDGTIRDGARGAPRFVTSGAIDVGRCAWGERPIRFGGERFTAPRVRVDRLSPTMTNWAARRSVPKVLVATQTRVLEACADTTGAMLPGVPVITVEPTGALDPAALCAAICSPAASLWAAANFSGAGLSAGALKLSARQLLGLPVPAMDAAAWAGAATSLDAGDVDGFAARMLAAHPRLDADDRHRVAAWWVPLARRARRPGA